MKTFKLSALTTAFIAALGLSACGGGGGGSNPAAGTSGTNVSSGVITGFGSVFVNGVEFETTNSSFTIDGQPGTEDDLAVGMIVTVSGSIDSDGVNGSATHISFSDELEGIVLTVNLASDGTGSLNIMGQNVQIDSATLFESKVLTIDTINQILPGNIIEVSGYSSGDGIIFATRIEVKLASHQGEEIEVKGNIQNLTESTFTLNELTVDFSSAQLDDIPNNVLTEGLFVEVKSRQGINDGGILIADKVELENDGDKHLEGDEGDDSEISGRVTSMTSETLFTVNGQPIQISENTRFENGNMGTLTTGALLNAEGQLDADGTLVADSIEFREMGEIEMEAKIEMIDADTNAVTILGQVIEVNNLTLSIDERQSAELTPERYFDLSDLAVGDCVEIRARLDSTSGVLVATKLERKNDTDSQAKLEGPLSAGTSPEQWQIAGVNLDLSAITNFTPSEGIKLEVEGSYDTGTKILTVLELSTDDENEVSSNLM